MPLIYHIIGHNYGLSLNINLPLPLLIPPVIIAPVSGLTNTDKVNTKPVIMIKSFVIPIVKDTLKKTIKGVKGINDADYRIIAVPKDSLH